MDNFLKFKSLETASSLAFVFLLVAYFFEISSLLLITIILLLIGLFWTSLALKIHHLWYGFSHKLGTVVTTVFLSLFFYGFLTPLALLYRFFNKDVMNLEAHKETYFHIHETEFDKSYFERLW